MVTVEEDRVFPETQGICTRVRKRLWRGVVVMVKLKVARGLECVCVLLRVVCLDS